LIYLSPSSPGTAGRSSEKFQNFSETTTDDAGNGDDENDEIRMTNDKGTREKPEWLRAPIRNRIWRAELCDA
jgi:hypothetical protein